MAHNKKNKYILVYIVQEYTLKMQKIGLSNVKIHKKISFMYPMSVNTFYNYLSVPAKKELRAMGVDFEDLKKRSEYINNVIPE